MKKTRELPFIGHIIELRNRLLWVVAAILIFAVIGYIIFPQFIQIVSSVLGEKLYINTIVEGFLTRMNVSVIFGSICALPVLIIQICLFVFPGLTAREKKIVLISIIAAFLLFAGGVIFSFQSILPLSVHFFKTEGFFPGNVGLMINYSKFIEFFFKFLLCCGLCFEFPVVLLVLVQLNILSVQMLYKNFKYVVIIIFIIAAVFAPDIISQITLALPMTGLYLLTLLAASLFKIGAR